VIATKANAIHDSVEQAGVQIGYAANAFNHAVTLADSPQANDTSASTNAPRRARLRPRIWSEAPLRRRKR